MKSLIQITILAISFTFTLSSFTQERKEILISGFVKNSLEKPISNVFIYIDNIKQDVTTNARGFYSIKFKKNLTKITFFSLQYGSLEVKYIKGMNKINVYYENKKSLVTTNNINESNKEIKDSNQYRDIFDYLRGKPGIEINNNNQIRIRGVNSLRGSTEPLVIINGRQESIDRLTDISPSIIKNIKVLKTADELAIYGVRGGNGVIVINLF